MAGGHSRTVAAIGELGFYFTYVTVGALWADARGRPWRVGSWRWRAVEAVDHVQDPVGFQKSA